MILMRSSEMKKRQQEQLRDRGYFALSPEERAQIQKDSFEEIRQLRKNLGQVVKSFSKEDSRNE